MNPAKRVAARLLTRTELRKALSVAVDTVTALRKDVARAEKLNQALRHQLRCQSNQTLHIIRALEVDNARLHTELAKTREERDLAWDDVDEVVLTGKLPDRPGRAA